MSELDRRDFLKVVGLSAGAAATVGCEPADVLLPYVQQPEEITQALPRLRQLLEALRIPVVTHTGYEADVLLARLNITSTLQKPANFVPI